MSNGALPLQPLEIKDFSGGMTDFYLQGDPKRFQKAENFIITVDKTLELRQGSVGFDLLGNHKMPGESRRVDAFLLFDADLLVNQGRDIYYRSPTWTALTGPSGSSALYAGSSFHQISQRTWREHLYLTSDEGSLPSKIYKDTTGTYQVRTVGLPLPRSTPGYTDSSLLAACINLANDLRTSMVSHMSDYSNTNPNAGPVDDYLHARIDKYSLSYFEDQTFNPLTDPEALPDPEPTPAPAATDEDTLYALCAALAAAYEHHAYDPENELYHFDLDVSDGSLDTIPPKGPYSPIGGNTTPTSLEQAAELLDEIRTKWYWHRFALFSHADLNDFDAMNKYPVTAPAIGTIDLEGVPTITPNFDDFIRYVNYLKNAYNQHVSNGRFGADFTAGVFTDFHSQTLNDVQYTAITLPDATDLDSAKLIAYWAWALYGALHVVDSNVASHPTFAMDTTAGSPNVTAVVDSGGDALELPIGAWIFSDNAIFDDAEPQWAQVSASASGTATLSKNLANTNSAEPGQYSFSVYHVAFSNGATVENTAFAAGADEFLDPSPGPGLSTQNQDLPETIEAWISFAKAVIVALKAHIENDESHVQGGDIENFFQGNGPFFQPETEEVAYAFTYKTEYTVESGLEFVVISEPIFVGPVETGKIYPTGTLLESGIEGVEGGLVEDVAEVTISNLPELENTTLTNYDTSGLVQIYRTIDGGNTYYLLDELDNGETSYTDETADEVDAPGNDRLTTREELYTTGGVVANTQPPICRFLHILNNTAYYGDVIDNGERFRGRIVQSVPGTPDGAPSNFTDDLDDNLEGLSSARNNLIAFCSNSIYRMEGGFTELGQGSLTHERISDTNGCISGASIVQTEIGVFFAGNDGFYYTDGFQLIKISIDLDLTYARYTATEAQKRAIQGSYDRSTRRIWWTIQSSGSGAGCDMAFIFYLNFGVKPSGVFTTASGGENFKPSSLVFYQGNMVRGDERGLVFLHGAEYLSDPEVPDDLDTALEDWNTAHIPYDYKSCALDFGTMALGQWVTKIHLLGENLGNVACQFYSIADNINDSRGKKPVAPIFYQDNAWWGDPGVIWGDEDCLWRYDGKVDYWRRFPHGNLRSQVKQIQLTPALVGVYRSDQYNEYEVLVDAPGTGSVTLTLQNTDIPDIAFPADAKGMVIALSFDDYETEYEITAVATGTTAVFTVSDADNELVPYDGLTAAWVVRGYLKEGSMSLLGYSLTFATTGYRGRAYGGATDRGENG